MWKDLKKVKELQAHLSSQCENVQKDAVDLGRDKTLWKVQLKN